MMNYDGKIFRPVVNADNGEVTETTIFYYHQKGNIVTAEYAGGSIIHGHLIALVDIDGCLNMRYHQVNEQGELRTGICRSIPERLPDGRIRLHETWQWTSGDQSHGHSVLEEMPKRDF